MKKRAMIPPRLKSEAGWSLIEVVVTTVAGAIILGATLQSITSFQRQFNAQQVAVSHQQDLRLALELLEQELRLATPDSLSTIQPEELEFGANIHGYQTTVKAAAGAGQSLLAVEDGRGWPGKKTILICWQEICEGGILARDGQASLLTLAQPLVQAVPRGASVSVSNRVRYYSKADEQGVRRLMRQIDGGAAVLVGAIEQVRFSYWDELGQRAFQSIQVRRIVVEVRSTKQSSAVSKDISLRM